MSCSFWAPITLQSLSTTEERTDDPSLVTSLASADKRVHVNDAKPGAVLGMTSWGEFGPILGVVLIDAAKSKLSWARWQQENGKSIAVFQFTVDRGCFPVWD